METLAQAMQRVKASADIRAFCDSHLEPRPRDGRDHYVCPACKSGNKRGDGRGTAAFHLYDCNGGKRFKCSSCGAEGDVFDLAGLVFLTDDKAEQCNDVAEWAGVDGWQRGGTATDRGEAMAWDGEATVTEPKQTRETGGVERDYTEGRERHREYIRRAQANIADPVAVAYLSSRGIDLETARAWGLGYDPEPKHGWQDESKQWHRSGRIVIPWPSVDGEEPYYHVDRATDARAKNLKYDKPSADEVGPQPLWNPDALKAPAFFCVEGQMDALAVAACGYEAVALGTSTDRNLVGTIQGMRGAGVALLMLDNDGVGHEKQSDLARDMACGGVAFLEVSTDELGVKDAGEAFANDRGSLAAWLGKWYKAGVEKPAEDALNAHIKDMLGLGVYDPANVTEGLFTMEDVLAPIPTGLSRVDNAIGGGLPAQGLVTLGAISSAGKTSWVLQICDHVAASGRPVLFCSVEQGRKEIAAKSLSRIMGTMARANGARILASAQAILNKEERERWEREDVEKVAAFTQACEVYHQRTHLEDGTPTLYIMEPNIPPTVADIRKVAEAIHKRHGQAPVIAVDYVQLLAAPAGLERGTEKQILDANTLGIRQVARDMQTCVIAISSLNRASYTGSIDLNSFKESGMLEYSSDLLLGMQPYGMQEAMRGRSEDSGATRAKAKEIMRDYKEAAQKQVELIVLKNRNGGIGKSPCLTFDGITSTFTEAGAPRAEKKPARL